MVFGTGTQINRQQSIADAFHLWLDLLSNPALQTHKKAVQKCFDDAVTVEHLVAYMLHPKFRGENWMCNSKSLWVNGSFSMILNLFKRWSIFKQRQHLSLQVSFPPRPQGSPLARGGKDWNHERLTRTSSKLLNGCLDRLHHQRPLRESLALSALFTTKFETGLVLKKPPSWYTVFCFRMLRGCNELVW